MPPLSIRPAVPADATHLACFVDMASGGMAVRLWETLRGPHQTLFEVGRSRALREDGAFSFRNGHIAEAEGAVAAGLVGYVIAPEHDAARRAPGPGEAAKLPALVRPLVELEALVPGYWYVNILATYPEYRGRGIGAALLARAEDIAATARSRGMALIVASREEGARRLYHRAGYRELARRQRIEGAPDEGDWLLMTKPIGSP
jgi:ribosomal protein S18 acetylase RimI-like enzyme